jgi:hypothetical protein
MRQVTRYVSPAKKQSDNGSEDQHANRIPQPGQRITRLHREQRDHERRQSANPTCAQVMRQCGSMMRAILAHMTFVRFNCNFNGELLECLCCFLTE